MRRPALVLVLVLGACTSPSDDPPAGRSPAPSPAIEGVRAFDRGLASWEDGVVLDDPHVLRVMTVGLSGAPSPCEEAVVVRAVRQSEAEVVVEARKYALAVKPTSYDCISMALGPRPHEVRLDQPLGGRRVIDASSGAAREVIAFDDFPTVQEVPAGYQWRPPTWDDGRRVVTRTWGGREGSLSLEIGPVRQLQALPAALKQGRLHGQLAMVTRVIMLSCVRWGPPERTLNLCSRDAGAGDPPLGPDELLAVGAGVRWLPLHSTPATSPTCPGPPRDRDRDARSPGPPGQGCLRPP